MPKFSAPNSDEEDSDHAPAADPVPAPEPETADTEPSTCKGFFHGFDTLDRTTVYFPDAPDFDNAVDCAQQPCPYAYKLSISIPRLWAVEPHFIVPTRRIPRPAEESPLPTRTPSPVRNPTPPL
ncbi:hypothetical protein K435DRAFT_864692 [Dendrothele bispora CBS 962.96]|uniref:Uncharacterized protein n=1 Tax=Dendrothele bispora (strain CBS 962.96) TaxID=1314807 RepID=A0A4S8LLB5_DENBC|nr:hypothetical protein K435DRAFT_864692 [Dendrothele bispora CBS 962.96]